jgi:hypothetical protein
MNETYIFRMIMGVGLTCWSGYLTMQFDDIDESLPLNVGHLMDSIDIIGMLMIGVAWIMLAILDKKEEK